MTISLISHFMAFKWVLVMIIQFRGETKMMKILKKAGIAFLVTALAGSYARAEEPKKKLVEIELGATVFPKEKLKIGEGVLDKLKNYNLQRKDLDKILAESFNPKGTSKFLPVEIKFENGKFYLGVQINDAQGYAGVFEFTKKNSYDAQANNVVWRNSNLLNLINQSQSTKEEGIGTTIRYLEESTGVKVEAQDIRLSGSRYDPLNPINTGFTDVELISKVIGNEKKLGNHLGVKTGDHINVLPEEIVYVILDHILDQHKKPKTSITPSDEKLPYFKGAPYFGIGALGNITSTELLNGAIYAHAFNLVLGGVGIGKIENEYSTFDSIEQRPNLIESHNELITS